MGIEQYLTVKDIDRALILINAYKSGYYGSTTSYNSVYYGSKTYCNFGLCWIFSQIQPAILEERINPIINLLLEIDGVKAVSDPDWEECFVKEWGDDQSVNPITWYKRRIGALLKARDILVRETYEYYV